MIDPQKMDEAKALVEGAKRIFIAVAPRPWLDTAAAAEFLARRLGGMGKEVLVSPAKLAPATKRLPFKTLHESLPPQDLVISVDTKPAEIGELRYEKNPGALRIFLSPKNDPIQPEAVQVQPACIRADLVIAVGVARFEDLGSLYQENPKLFFERSVLSLSKSGEEESESDCALVDREAETLSELAVAFIKNLEENPLSPEEATLILAGLLSETSALVDNDLSPGSLKLASDCLEAGADRAAVLSVVQIPAGEARFRLFGRSIVRSRRVAPRLTLALITETDFAATDTTPAETAEILMLWERHLETPFLLLLWQDPQTKTVSGLVRGKDEILSARLPSRIFGKVRKGIFFIRDSYQSFREAEEALVPAFLDLPERG